MIATLFAGLLPKLIAGAVGAIAILAVYLGIRKSGVQAKQNADMKATMRDVERRNAVEREVASESDASVADDLRKQRGG